jgi:hypothetical protein
LKDSIQSTIESIIRNHISDYGYGTRREDQSQVIDLSNLFESVIHLNSKVKHYQTISECVEAWRSHATLERQAGSSFKDIIHDIETYLLGLDVDTILIPYTTNIWMSRLK